MKARALILTTAIAGLVWPVSAAKPIKTDDLSNLIIQGQNRLHVNAPILEVAWAPDIYKGFTDLLADPILVGSLKSPAVTTPPATFPSQLGSEKTARPWLRTIHDAPILTMATKGSGQGKVEWTFLVKDSQGKIFFERKEKGTMPDKIEWNGFGKDGKALFVGYDYTYSLSIIDMAGNPQRFSGKPFAISAFRFRQAGRTATHITPSMLFGDESSAKLTKEGMRLLLEVKDSFRSGNSGKVDIVTFDNDTKFGLARSNAIASFLMNILEWDEKRVQAKTQSIDAKGYRHVEIIAQ